MSGQRVTLGQRDDSCKTCASKTIVPRSQFPDEDPRRSRVLEPSPAGSVYTAELHRSSTAPKASFNPSPLILEGNRCLSAKPLLLLQPRSALLVWTRRPPSCFLLLLYLGCERSLVRREPRTILSAALHSEKKNTNLLRLLLLLQSDASLHQCSHDGCKILSDLIQGKTKNSRKLNKL